MLKGFIAIALIVLLGIVINVFKLYPVRDIVPTSMQTMFSTLEVVGFLAFSILMILIAYEDFDMNMQKKHKGQG